MPSAFTAYGRGNFAIAVQLLVILATAVLLYRYKRIDPFIFAAIATFLVVPYVLI